MPTKPSARAFQLKTTTSKARTTAKKKVVPKRKNAVGLDLPLYTIDISNFKSINKISFKPARVNVFIGEPNAGKSNILEALALTNVRSVMELPKLPSTMIRYSDMASLFFDKNYDKDIRITVGEHTFILDHMRGKFFLRWFSEIKNEWELSLGFDKSGGIIDRRIIPEPPVFKYHFRGIPGEDRGTAPTTAFRDNLDPDGWNLWKIIRHDSRLKEFAGDFFSKFSFKILFEKNSNRLDIMRISDDHYYQIDFSMTPDTFQRMLYYLAAIESNKNSVLLFEEPESQSYPPYIQMLADRIIDDKHNQYFITTHSPFVIEKMLEHASVENEVKIFITYYEDFQTKVRELTRKEIIFIMDNNVDLFFNMQAFQKEPKK
ncbi:MAG: AAA family ATPase [Bacteroidetes bacterium]|nr:AAA family ATPase [Bacteroidota bacterium]